MDTSAVLETLGFHLWQTPAERSPVLVFRYVDHPTKSLHDHLFHEVVLIEKGTGIHVTAAGRQTLRAGNLFIIHPQVWHAIEQTDGLTLTNLLIAPELMRQFKDNFDSTDQAFELFHRRRRQPRLHPPIALHATPAQAHSLLELIGFIEKEHKSRTYGWRISTALMTMQVLVLISRIAHGLRQAEPAEPLLPAVREAVSYLEAHFDQTVTLDELADHCAAAPSHLSRQFNRQMGMGINAFIHRLRAEEACRLLRTTRRPIAAISLELGYKDVAYFSRCFHQQTGSPPRAYREGRQEGKTRRTRHHGNGAGG